MRRWIFVFILLMLVSALSVGTIYGQDIPSKQQLPSSVWGYAHVAGDVQFELFLSPPITSPRQPIVATFRVTNDTKEVVMPRIIIPFLPNLSLNTSILPASTGLDMVNQQMVWQPVVPAGEQRQIQLEFVTEVVNLDEPERSFPTVFVWEKVAHEVSARYWVGQPPTTNIVTSQLQVAVGQPIQLIAETEGTGPFTQIWALGDGRYVEATNPVVMYSHAGIYEISVQVANPLAVSETTTTVEVLDTPKASFTLNDMTPSVGQVLQFINTSGGQPPLIYTWDFGDGQASHDLMPQHQYESAGNYLVSLSVQSSTGQNNFILPITVGTPPVAQITALPNTVIAGEPITMQANGAANVTRYQWDMGDGSVLEGAEAVHTFLSSGDFYVWLLAENQYGTTQVGQWITVLPNSQINTFYLPVVVNHPTIVETTVIQPTVPANTTTLTVERVLLEESTISDTVEAETFEPISLEPAPLPDNTTEAEFLLWYINEARRLHNLPPLSYVYELSIAAQHHAEDMGINEFTSHTGSDGSRPYQRFTRYGYENKYAGEATAWGFSEPHQTVEFWVNSPPHRRIILNPEATEVGVGYYSHFNAPSVWYWVAEFGKDSRSLEEPEQ